MAEGKIGLPPPPQTDWAYFLDMDGTLIELAETPEGILVDEALLDLVWRLHGACGGALALVSGRTLADLDRRVGGMSLAMAGQHGLERRCASGRVQVQATSSAAKDEIAQHLAALAARHPGLHLEDKGMTLAIHYRQAPQLASYVHRMVRNLIADAKDGLYLQKGKRVVEVKPSGFDKGSAIRDYMKEPPFLGRLPVFVGDDVTDEHGFAVVNELQGLSVKVGSGATQARYRLPNVAAVRQWLAAALGGRNEQS